MGAHIDPRHDVVLEKVIGDLDVKDLRVLEELHKAIREQTAKIAIFVALTSLANVAFATFIASI